MNRNPKKRATGGRQNGTYAPPTSEQNIRSFEHFPVSRENVILNSHFYGGRGYGNQTDFINRNSRLAFNNSLKLNKENPFKWMPNIVEGKGPGIPSHSVPPIDKLVGFPIDLFNENQIFLLNEFLLSMEVFVNQYIV